MTRLHDAVLEREWLPVASSEEINGTPKQVLVLGEQVALFRLDGQVHAFRDLCIHRGTALSLGRVEEGTLVCPYHGWRYDMSGQCVRIPAQPPEQSIPTKAKATVYAAAEAYGLVWVNLSGEHMSGEGASPLAPFPEAGDASFHSILCGPYEVDAEAPRVIENFLDVSHLMWVHEGLLGEPSHAEIPDYHVHDRNACLETDPIDILQPDPDGRGKVVTNRYVYSILRPMCVRFRKTDPDTSEVFSMLLATLPVSERRTKAFIVLSRNYGFDLVDNQFRQFQDKVFSQDESILLSQRPEELPLDLQVELHLKSDRLAIAYRQYLEQTGVTIGVA
ncbi:MAG: aromatic ring-hydroxylating dioxygenase subunit alpha [Deinococcota bacterium]